ncbi:hypothetical protein [Cyclobacterium amurskyense]|uniref:hypothetical protein n=1 Tax=Cyclobacterium amurskyense TaxID=320787 RepID=UPI00146FFF4B|nr:hypothetical protein [Cyclobacterium amurskyense]
MTDIELLPSVLDIKEVNHYLIQLINLLENDNTISKSQGAAEINNLISYQGYNEQGLNVESSQRILSWIRSNYDPNCKDSIEWNSANLANLNCSGVEEFINKRIENSDCDQEKDELKDCLKEIKKAKLQ